MSGDENFLDCINREESGADTIVFDGCNIHVRSGAGSTDATIDGKGNILIGYNEPAPDRSREVLESAEGLEDIGAINVEAVELVTDSRRGLHNLIVGDEHASASYGGTVTGKKNEIIHKSSAVVGGWDRRGLRRDMQWLLGNNHLVYSGT